MRHASAGDSPGVGNGVIEGKVDGEIIGVAVLVGVDMGRSVGWLVTVVFVDSLLLGAGLFAEKPLGLNTKNAAAIDKTKTTPTINKMVLKPFWFTLRLVEVGINFSVTLLRIVFYQRMF